MTTATSALGRELQLVHAAQWLYTVNDEPFVPGEGDPYARLVRGFDEDTDQVLASIAERGPLWRSRLDAWVGTDHETTRRLLNHPDTAVAAAVPQAARWLPETDRRRSRGLIRELAYRGGVRAVGAYEGRLVEETGRAVDRLAPGPADLVEDFVAPLTASVYAGLLAVPNGRRAEFAAQLGSVAPAVDALLCPQTLTVTRRLATGLPRLREIVAGQGHAEADLILAVAGARAAADLLGNALAVLLERPAAWDRLRAEPVHAAQVVAEVLRLQPPWRAHPLTALAPIEVGGARIEAGESVTAVTAAADRRPAHPSASANLAAPYGRLLVEAARAQTERALVALAARFPRVLPDGGPVRARRAPVTRRLVRLSVRLGEEETR
ncbi:cytochrome P450 family protein [Streptomyces niveus]|uniref:hypothetical protein n=1 Tax=Streptomyces niveus TaxID=193462 RepID=UPI003631C161